MCVPCHMPLYTSKHNIFFLIFKENLSWIQWYSHICQAETGESQGLSLPTHHSHMPILNVEITNLSEPRVSQFWVQRLRPIDYNRNLTSNCPYSCCALVAQLLSPFPFFNLCKHVTPLHISFVYPLVICACEYLFQASVKCFLTRHEYLLIDLEG